jgi:uncharacterized membrane protein YoaT (DUF817 family)
LLIIRSSVSFVLKQLVSCLFPITIFLMLALSKEVHLPFLHRYDALFLGCLTVQAVMVWTGMESREELKVTACFHLIGLGLELFKVQMGSWSYPEEAWTKIGGVPLYSGFMYASVASYFCQAWKRLRVRLEGWPGNNLAIAAGCAIYFNFFTHHFFLDFRWIIALLLVVLFHRTHVEFSVGTFRCRMPLILSFLLTGFMIWVAENIATFLGAWQYPHQRMSWDMVDPGKISSWCLLVIVIFILTVRFKHQESQLPTAKTDGLAVHQR